MPAKNQTHSSISKSQFKDDPTTFENEMWKKDGKLRYQRDLDLTLESKTLKKTLLDFGNRIEKKQPGGDILSIEECLF